MGPTALLPLRMKACWGLFFALKNPTASAGFEPAMLARQFCNWAVARKAEELRFSSWQRQETFLFSTGYRQALVYIHSVTAVYSTEVTWLWLEAAQSLPFVAKFVHQLSRTLILLYSYIVFASLVKFYVMFFSLCTFLTAFISDWKC